MVVLASVLVGIEILVLSLVGTRVWAQIYLSPPGADALRIDVQAEQFAYYFRYPGPDGKFGAVHPELIDEANYNFFGLDPANDTTARDDIVSATPRRPAQPARCCSPCTPRTWGTPSTSPTCGCSRISSPAW